MISAKKFLGYSFSSLILILIIYLIIVDQLVFIQREIPFSYKQFLLESSTAIKGKIIIDSGSNSVHGIDSILLSKTFNRPVINIADNASYPLRFKIFNLEKYAQKGDIIIFPLEWLYYTYKKDLSKDFINLLADQKLRLEYYYNSLPYMERVYFILNQYPLNQVVQSLKYERDKQKIILQDLTHLKTFMLRLQKNSAESWGNSSNNGPESRVIPPINNTCKKYLFHNGFEISSEFKKNLKLLKRLRDKDIDIYFTWPATVDHQLSKCYVDLEHFNNVSNFAQDIKELVTQQGFQFIGDFQNSHFTEKCFLNTHYHLKHECAAKRTKQMVQAIKLQKISLKKQQGLNIKFSTEVKKYIIKQRKRLLKMNDVIP